VNRGASRALSELLPLAENRVTLADETDEHGVPIARMDYTQCDNDRANIAAAKQTLHDIWETAGAQDVLTIDRYARLAGGCRMGAEPESSVVDAEHHAWGVPNLFVALRWDLPARPRVPIFGLKHALSPSVTRTSSAKSRRVT
jgi:choline dehydrogenase-like flavoprotein